MSSLTTFYLSWIIDKKLFNINGKSLGIIKDLLVDTLTTSQEGTYDKPRVIGIKLKAGKDTRVISYDLLSVIKKTGKVMITSVQPDLVPLDIAANGHLLAEVILDKQIVDLNGRKLVRVNDVRLVSVATGTFAIAVDIGLEGLLRRIGVSGIMKSLLKVFNLNLPAKFILWDDVQAIDFSKLNIKLSKSYTKLHTLHPSDLADIIEDLGRHASATVFSALDEEKAADVLEELEPNAQIQMVESLPVEKMADVLEKMPADEVVDILDELEEEKAESLLNEMATESSREVRELLEYTKDMVGSIMTTDVIYFNEDKTVDDILKELRIKKPEQAELYNLFVTENNEELIGTFTLRDLVISEPLTPIKNIMKSDPISLSDVQKIEDIAEIISKYNLLAVPVVDQKNLLQGMVVVDDVVEDLIKKRRTKKKR
jgi:magnesium transporter